MFTKKITTVKILGCLYSMHDCSEVKLKQTKKSKSKYILSIYLFFYLYKFFHTFHVRLIIKSLIEY